MIPSQRQYDIPSMRDELEKGKAYERVTGIAKNDQVTQWVQLWI
jgi:hypothetical protein